MGWEIQSSVFIFPPTKIIMEKYKNKYRISSHRKPNWDYSADALYFLTIVTQNRVCNLGEIVETHGNKVETHSNNVETHGNNVETHGNNVETHGNNVETHSNNVETHGNNVETYGNNVETHGINVETHGNNVEIHGINVKTHGNNVETHGINVETHGRGSLRKSPSYEMLLSDFGNIVEFEWFKSFEIRKELILHEFIVMPNHLHTIVEIYNKNRVETNADTSNLETHGCVSIPKLTIDLNNEILKIKQNPPVRLPKSISSFIAGFKSSVNTQIDNLIDEHKLALPKFNRNNHFFQPNYHDHIIRNHTENQAIKNYIANNPKNWAKDKFHT